MFGIVLLGLIVGAGIAFVGIPGKWLLLRRIAQLALALFFISIVIEKSGQGTLGLLVFAIGATVGVLLFRYIRFRIEMITPVVQPDYTGPLTYKAMNRRLKPRRTALVHIFEPATQSRLQSPWM